MKTYMNKNKRSCLMKMKELYIRTFYRQRIALKHIKERVLVNYSKTKWMKDHLVPILNKAKVIWVMLLLKLNRFLKKTNDQSDHIHSNISILQVNLWYLKVKIDSKENQIT